jgi:hypothetical protein
MYELSFGFLAFSKTSGTKLAYKSKWKFVLFRASMRKNQYDESYYGENDE